MKRALKLIHRFASRLVTETSPLTSSKLLALSMLLTFTSCYEVREDQCEVGQVRCEDGKARNCVEVNFWSYWQDTSCFQGTICTIDGRGDAPVALCALGETPDERCPPDAEGWICLGNNEAVRCQNGFAVSQQRCPPSSECVGDETAICTDPTEPAPYCEGERERSPICIDSQTRGYCGEGGIPGAEIPCTGSARCIENRCQLP